MDEEQAEALAVDYVKDQLESIGNDSMDVSEYLYDLGEDDGEYQMVMKHVQIIAARVRESINIGGKE